MVTPGIYQHFKGGLYRVIGTARHSETDDALVIYENSEGQLWARPEWMFTESVVPPGGHAEEPRFRLIRGVRMGHISINDMLKAR